MVGTRKLAKALGVSPSAVTKAVKEKRVTPACLNSKGDPQFIVEEARQEWLEKTAPLDSTGRCGIRTSDENTPTKDKKDAGDIARYNKARADREEAEAEKALLELGRLKQTLLPAVEVKVVWTQLMKGASQKFSGLPVHMLSRFPGLTADGRDYMRQRIREILDDLADWNLDE